MYSTCARHRRGRSRHALQTRARARALRRAARARAARQRVSRLLLHGAIRAPENGLNSCLDARVLLDNVHQCLVRLRREAGPDHACAEARGRARSGRAGGRSRARTAGRGAVSYTHLTLPTIYSG